MNAEQRANLRKLADYLDTTEPQHFNMADYVRSARGVSCPVPTARVVHACSSVCCALGSGPRAGMPAKEGENWATYGSRVFGLVSPTWYGRSLGQGYGGDWCFAASWESTDNSPQGAAARIRYLLDLGVPSNWTAQMNGNAPLCYSTGSTS